MTDQVGKYNVNNTLQLENTFSVKREESQNDDFADDKLCISEIIDNPELKDHFICDKIKQDNISSTLANIKTELFCDVQYDIKHDNLKTEQGISTDNIKNELNGLIFCEDCRTYCEDYCAKCGMLVQILNRTFPGKAGDSSQLELPNGILEIKEHFREFHVFTLKVIPAGVKFGPFTGLNRTDVLWKVKGGKFIQSKDKSKYLNWMHYINPAMNISEQNLLVFQYEHSLYYQSTCQIQAGSELLVYFGEEYEESLNRNVEMDFIPTIEHSFKNAFVCTFCCFGFSSKSYLIKHKAVCPANAGGTFTIEELMECQSCKIHLDRKEYFMHHMAYCSDRDDRKCISPMPTKRIARPRLAYKCQRCKYRTKYKGDLKNHNNQHYQEKIYKCNVCCRRFKRKEVLRLHVENTDICAGRKEDSELSTGDHFKGRIKVERSCWQDEAKEFKCSLCAFRTNYNKNLKIHLKSKHLQEFKYKCDLCDYKTNYNSYLKIHIETKHLKEFKYQCDTCDYKANFKANLKRHTDAKHLREFKYKCDTCGYKSDRKSQLEKHIKAKHLKEMYKYKCDVCDYKVNKKLYLKRHIATRHLKEFKYTCDICDYKTNWNHNLKTHIVTRHLQELKYTCDACDYKSNCKFDLKKHVDGKHLKEFKYKCDTCNYKTNWNHHLKTHIKTRHLKEFKYKCDRCDYKTNQNCKLKVHVEGKHLKEFKYQCDTCAYKSNFKSDLKSHIDGKHLKELKYKCDTCGYKANFKSNLRKHIKRQHLNELK